MIKKITLMIILAANIGVLKTVTASSGPFKSNIYKTINDLISWTPNSLEEFVNSTFNSWLTEADCKSLLGTPTILADCQGAHYPNELCCGDLTQAKLAGLAPQSLQAAPSIALPPPPPPPSIDPKTIDHLVTLVTDLNTRIIKIQDTIARPNQDSTARPN